MRCSSLAILGVAVLAAAGCGGSSSDRSTAHPNPGPTGTAGAGTTGKSNSHAKRPATPGGRTVSSPQRIAFLEKSFFGAKSQVTYFVVKPAAGSPLEQARACVRENQSKAPSAYCFAFASERALRFAKVSRRPPAKMGRPCWSAYWGKPKGRPGFGSGDNPAAHALRCPNA